jgi:CheY-like chemotaxis protein
MSQTILIVDDDPVQRRLLEAAISRIGLDTMTAPGGGPALWSSRPRPSASGFRFRTP